MLQPPLDRGDRNKPELRACRIAQKSLRNLLSSRVARRSALATKARRAQSM